MCVKGWKQFQERSIWNPQRQFGEESLEIGRWIGTMMFRRTRYNVTKTLQLQLDRRKQRPLEGTILCDLLIVDPPSLSSASFCFFSVSSLCLQ